MGRVRKLRKYKACDPFNKKSATKDIYDRAPDKSADDDHFKETKSVLHFRSLLEIGKNCKRKKKHSMKNEVKHSSTGLKRKSLERKESDVIKKHATKEDNDDKLEQQPNESNWKYLSRLDTEIHEAKSKLIADSKQIRKKRKIHLKNRDEKKKVKREQRDVENVGFSHLKDHVVFGDVAMEPPQLNAVPRKASKKQKEANSELKLTSLLSGGTKSSNRKDSGTASLSETARTKKRKLMTEAQKRIFDAERQEAIDAYRLSKQRKLLKS